MGKFKEWLNEQMSRREALSYLGSAGLSAAGLGAVGSYLAKTPAPRKKSDNPVVPLDTGIQSPQETGSISKQAGEKGQGKDFGNFKPNFSNVYQSRGKILNELGRSNKDPQFRKLIHDTLNDVAKEQNQHWKSQGIVRGHVVDQEWLGPNGKRYTKQQWNDIETTDWGKARDIMYDRVADILVKNYTGGNAINNYYKWVEEVLWPKVQEANLNLNSLLLSAEKRLNPPGRIK